MNDSSSLKGNVAWDDESCWFGSVQGASSPRLYPFVPCLWLTNHRRARRSRKQFSLCWENDNPFPDLSEDSRKKSPKFAYAYRAIPNVSAMDLDSSDRHVVARATYETCHVSRVTQYYRLESALEHLSFNVRVSQRWREIRCILLLLITTYFLDI